MADSLEAQIQRADALLIPTANSTVAGPTNAEGDDGPPGYPQ
jgi:hypothetical protein